MSDSRGELSTEAQLLGLLSDQLEYMTRLLHQNICLSQEPTQLVQSIVQQRKELLGR